MAFTSDAGQTFSTPSLVAGEQALGRVDVAMIGPDAALVGWIEPIAGSDRALIKVRRVGRDGSMSPELVIATTSGDRSSGFPRLASTGDGVLVAYTELAPERRVRARLVRLEDLPMTTPSGSIEKRTLTIRDGTVVTYRLVLPRDFKAGTPYPALLALPPGPQTDAMVEAGLNRYWGEQAAERGWIVVSPVAPNGETFYAGGERVIPELLEAIAREFSIEHGRFHLAGASNGGRSAFRVALDHPDRFLSLTVLPGMPPRPEDFAMLPLIAKLPVTMFVGGSDSAWLPQMERTSAALKQAGGRVSLTVLPGEGHVPPSLDGAVVMEHLEEIRTTVNRTLGTTGAATGGDGAGSPP